MLAAPFIQLGAFNVNTPSPITGAIRPTSALNLSLQNHLAGIVCDLESLRNALPMPESSQVWSLLDSARTLTRQALDRITADLLAREQAGTFTGGLRHD